MAEPTTKTKRILELDALRAFAAINLLLFHFTLVYQNKYGYVTPLGFDLPFGKYGVQLFFMLSGFVNAMTLLKKRDPTNFIAARFIRIFPSFWIVILLNALLFSTCTMFAVQPDVSQFAANMTVMPKLFGYDCWEPVTWTLQVEMLFYFVLMILFMGGALNKPLRTAMVMTGIAGFGVPLVRSVAAAYPETTIAGLAEFLSSLFILKWLPLFMMGLLLYQIKIKNGNMIHNALGILAAATVFHVIDDHGHNPAATVILFGMLILSAYGKIPLFRWKPLMVVSASSYALYLFHNNLGCLLINVLDHSGVPSLLCLALGIVASFVFAVIYTYKFEQPFTKMLRGKWISFYEKRKTSAENVVGSRSGAGS